MERLEDRTLLTTTLFFDFGAGFAAAGFDTTVAGFRDIDGANTGTDMTQGTTTNPTGMAAAAPMNLARIDYDFDGNGTPGEVSDVNALSATVLPLIQRVLEPFDIIVMAAAATNFTDVQNSLNANNGDATGEFDAYNFIVDVTSTMLGGGGSGSVGDSYGLFGRAASPDLDAQMGNDTDEATLTFVDVVLDSTSGIMGTAAFNANLAARIAYTAVHEAFHTLTYVHATGFSGNVAGQTLMTSGDVIRLGSNTREDPFIVTRFDLQRDGGQAVTEPNNYLLAANDPDIGLRDSDGDSIPDLAYVTGTGAHDRITLTNMGGGIVGVQVDAFSDAARTTLIASESYTINLATDTEGPILIDASINSDEIVIDGTIATTIRVRGGTGEDGVANAVDGLVVNAGGLSGSYTPTAADGGTIALVGGATILASELEMAGEIDVNNVMIFALMGSIGADNLTLANSSGAARVTGTVNGGTGIVPLNLTTITTLNFNTVGGLDRVTVSLSGGNPIPGGGVGVDGGAQTDTLVIQGATATYTPDAGAPNDASRGRLNVSGSTVDFVNMEFVTPVAPVITDLSLTETNIDENDAITLSGTFTDPGSLSSHTLTINWGDGTPSQMIPLAVGARSFSVPYQYLDDNPTNTPIDLNTITVTVTDNDALTDMDTTPITVNNLDPVIVDFASDATLENKAEEGEPVNILGNFTDVGTLDTHTAVVDWGDGSPLEMVTIVEAGGVGTISGSHIYQFGGIFTVTVTLTDDDTGTAMTTTTAVVTGIGINNGVMQIVGSNDDDQVAIYREFNGNYLIVADFLNTVGTYRRFNAADFSSIEATLCVGNDLMTMSPNIAVPMTVDAGEGNDQVYAGGALSLTALGGNGKDTIFGTRGNDVIDGGEGNDTIDGGDGNDILQGGGGNDLISSGFGNDVLVGGGGNDRLSGSYGNNLLIGGGGVDLLISGSGANMLIGGSTIHDADNTALQQILDVWASTDPYVMRTNRIRNGIGVPMLDAASIIDDGMADTLTGGFGSDWFFSGAGDSLIGRLLTEDVD